MPDLPQDALAPFGPVTRAWFEAALGAPTPVQAQGWARIAAGDHTLMLAPTGSGKTLAGFLWALDRLIREPPTGPGVRVLYVSPIKALAYDVEKNLRLPLAGMIAHAQAMGAPIAPVRIDVRTGDTPERERRRQAQDPAPILITTPESLYLLLGARAGQHLATVDTVIIDEIHALAPTKRGAHLALSLERLAHVCRRDPQRIGLSATQRPLEVVARYLGGDRPVAIVDAGQKPQLDLQIIAPAADMSAPPPVTDGEEKADRGLWPSIYPLLVDLVLAHVSTIVFVNSRRLAERLAQAMSEVARAQGRVSPGVELVRAHHGSIARAEREVIEGELKAGTLRAICATSSLELGIDMGAVDLVIQVESPGAIARGLQRIGRARHQVGGTPKGRIIPKFRGDLLEAAVIAREMLAGHVEAIAVPENALDVLAQQIVAMCAAAPWTVDELAHVVGRAAGYRDLSRAALVEVIEMLAGRYPSDDFADLRPRIAWDRTTDVLTARRGARLLSVISGGTIPDRGLYPVHRGDGGPRIGELDEEMVHESRVGETFILGASTWRIEAIEANRVIVSPAPGEPGKMPFWRGDSPGRPVELGRAIGGFLRKLDAARALEPEAVTRAWLADEHRLDPWATDNLLAHVDAQRAAGAVPTDRTIVIERFRDALGDWRVCILTPFGARVHAPWALALERRLAEARGAPVHALATDDGIALRFADGDRLPDTAELLLDPATIDDEVTRGLAQSSALAARFREAAARALLLPRRRPGLRTPLWTMRQRATQLLGVAMQFPSFPIVLEAYRELLADVFDLPALRALLASIEDGRTAITAIETAGPSPFAQSLAFDYVAAYLYEGDAPPVERRAQALTLDRGLLRQLTGEVELETLLDPAAVAEVERELAGGRLPAMTGADDLEDVLRRFGDATEAELVARGADPAWLAALAAQGRAIALPIAGETRWVTIDDRDRYLAAIDPSASASDAALASLLHRWARTHGVFAADAPADRWGVARDRVERAIAAALASGALSAAGHGRVVEPDVARRLRRRTLDKLRAEVAPVPPAAVARFLARWHEVGAGRRGLPALRDAIARLDGCAMPFTELESRVLPARVADYAPRMLDELGARGEIVWMGAGAAGGGAVRICGRRRAGALVAAGSIDGLEGAGPVHAAIVACLRRSGAQFLIAIEDAVTAAVITDRGAIRTALWDLVWAGVLTNDTFAPLRGTRGAKPARPSRARVRATPIATAGGRWSLVEALAFTAPSPTERAHAQATALLDRWGVVARDVTELEGTPGGFAGLVVVLDGLEEAGAIRRGDFVVGLSGRQYAWPGALDRLRAARDEEGGVVALSAIDPASPWGALAPWPATTGENRAARRAGAIVITVGGEPVFWVEPRARRLSTFAATTAAHASALAAVPALTRRALTIEQIDGAPAHGAALAAAIRAAGARADYRGLVLDPAPRAAAAVAGERENLADP
ncbi:MAG: DEAD/DEAH box helicase [Deltaproteobacteria bacterium]|nr:DEAD/DEAH box helicase [Deltaproteobacteria bacterium]